MNTLSLTKRVQILNLLVEGNSMRATSRIANVSINTVTKLLVDIGRVCAQYQHITLRNLPCQRIQVDEIWSFCYAKAKNLPAELKGAPGLGDVWTWTAICPDTKLVPSWFVGGRNALSAHVFMRDLARRMAGRIQLTSDGFHNYPEAVDAAFGSDVDYAMLIKLYGPNALPEKLGKDRYVGAKRTTITGSPDKKLVSTSMVERQNLTMRMSIKRFARRTNAFSKKVENHNYAVALHFMYYNFCRIHKSLRVTPAMQAGVSNHVWSLEEVIKLAENSN